MNIQKIHDSYSVTGQILPEDIARLGELGFKVVINNRPDDEAEDQPGSDAMQAACEAAGIEYHYLPVVPNNLQPETAMALDRILAQDNLPVLGFCRTGNRSTQVWNLRNELVAQSGAPAPRGKELQVVIIGGGAGGIATAASLLKRDPNLDISIIEPRDEHYYQPGWTLVGGGVFEPRQCIRTMASVIPRGVNWIRDAVAEIDPDNSVLHLENGGTLKYEILVVSPGLRLAWEKVEGLEETLGQNGVTSNYSLMHAPQTWENVQKLKTGRAVFTQPPMPIKCAGAPQKALYLSADHWQKAGCLDDIEIDFYNAGGVLFGVPDYVPALETYIEQYGVNLNFNRNLVAVDGPAQKAWFADADGDKVEVEFDMMHVTPPQCGPDVVKPLANDAGWVDVDPATLQHTTYSNVYSLGDVTSAPNAKTAAAVRKQAPVVAHNIVAQLSNKSAVAHYDGYGSCPLIVERGKVVLAEFGYGGKLLPSMPAWMLNGKQPTWAGWFLKATLLPPIYFGLMLKGHEWLARPQIVSGELAERVTQ